MKRRDFLVGAASSASLLYLKSVSAARPCPPNLSGASAATCSAIDAEMDWQSRISGPGVVWHHNFASEAEVSRFRWESGYGNITDGSGQGTCTRVTSDGITGGGCLQLEIPAGGHCNTSWIRPFSPLTGATNGRGADDPGANGSITPLTWNVSGTASSPFDYVGKWKDGVYSHRDYWDHPTRGSGGGWGSDGDEFYIQFRVKMPASRGTSGNPDGKLAGIMLTGNGTSHITPNQEIVIQSLQDPISFVYTNFGNRTNSILGEIQGDGFSNAQPGSNFTSCDYPNVNSSNCGYFPWDEWVTVLVHVKAGHDGGGGDNPVIAGNPANNTTLQIYHANSGATEYTVMHDKDDYVWSFGEFDATPYGWNAVQMWAFMNGVNSVAGWTHRYDEIIFSKEFIPCPQV